MSLAPRRSDRKREFWLHPAVQGLLNAEDSVRCPREAIRRRVGRVVEEAINLGWSGPPFEMDILASLHGFELREDESLSSDQDGCLIPGARPQILVNPSSSPRRVRFTIAHEVVHTLIPDPSMREGQRHWKYRREAQSPVEQLCQVGAGELLMPTVYLRREASGEPVTSDAVIRVHEAFKVSVEAALRNLVDQSDHGCAMCVLRMMNKPSELHDKAQVSLPGLDPPVPEKRLRIVYGWTSRAWDERYFPRFKSVPEESVAYRASHQSFRYAEEDWTGVGGLGACTVEVVRQPGDPDGVLCLISEPPS